MPLVSLLEESRVLCEAALGVCVHVRVCLGWD